MPALITHNYFAKEVYKKMGKRIQNDLKPALNFYYVFAQSFDNLFYYRIPLIIGGDIRKFGSYCQHHNTQSYFINMIRIIKDNNLANNPNALAYLYGSITHYVLDSVAHPFVFYKTGTYKKNNKEHHKYNGLHARMEYMIDAYMYKKTNEIPFHKYKFYNDILPKIKVNEDIKFIVNETYHKTFNKKDICKYYFKGYNWSRFCYRTLVYDSIGLKKVIYKIIDKMTPSFIEKVQYYSFHIKDIDSDYLNNEKKTWNHPCDSKIKFDYSFDELYNIALKRTLEIISKVNLVLNDEKDIKDLLEIIPNIDYATGLLIQKNRVMKSFEF